MTDTVETHPELNALLWDEHVAHVDSVAAKYHDAFDGLKDDAIQSLLGLFAAFLAKHPHVEKVAVVWTDEQYNDETYGGYYWIGARVMFNISALTDAEKDWLQNHSDSSYINDDDYDNGGAQWTSGEAYGWRYRSSGEVPARLKGTLDEVNTLDGAVKNLMPFCQAQWGVSTALVVDKNGLQVH